MNEVYLFINQEFGEVRTATIDDKPYFCGKDIAQSLGYSEPHKAIARHTKGGMKHTVPTKGGNQQLVFIPEGDVIRLVVKSKLPTAEKFESWVFDEVLPSIRKHGGYIINQENMSPEQLIANALVFANNIIDDQKNQIETANLFQKGVDGIRKILENRKI